MKTFQNLSKTFMLLIAVSLFAGCGARKVNRASTDQISSTKSDAKVITTGSTTTLKADSVKKVVVKTDQSKVQLTATEDITADSAVHDPTTGKTTFKGNVKYSGKHSKNTDKDKKSTETTEQGFKESTNSNFVNDAAVHDESDQQTKTDTKEVDRQESFVMKPWFWILIGIVVVSFFAFKKWW